jgi:hypothetical protein
MAPCLYASVLTLGERAGNDGQDEWQEAPGRLWIKYEYDLSFIHNAKEEIAQILSIFERPIHRNLIYERFYVQMSKVLIEGTLAIFHSKDLLL